MDLSSFLDLELAGAIARDFDNFGDGREDGTTRTIVTHELENLVFLALSKGLSIHPQQHWRPVRIFSCADKISQAWIAAIPSPLSHIPSREFSKIMAAFLALPSPVCKDLVGSKLQQSGRIIDAHGDAIMCEKLPFDTWRTRHDQAKIVIRGDSHGCWGYCSA